MKNLNGRLLAAILVPLAIGGTIAGCGDNDNNTATSGSGGGAQTTPKPAASAPDVDKAFVRQMIPHHQMAVQMAKIAKVNGQHAEIKDLAAAIISAQNNEITELKAIADELGVSADMPMGESGSGASMSKDAQTLGLKMNQMGMSMDMHSLAEADPFDQAFIDEMTPHHRGAIAMANAELAGGENAKLKTIATEIVSAQKKEIAEMAQWKADWYSGATANTGDPGDQTSGDMSEMGH